MPDILALQLTEEARHNLAAAISYAGIYGFTIGAAIDQFDKCECFTPDQLAVFDLIDFPNQEAAIELARQLL